MWPGPRAPRWLAAIPLIGSEREVTGAVVTFLDITRQRSLDVALRLSEAHLRSVVESVPGYVLLVDRALTIRFCNRLLAGVDPAQVQGQSALGFVQERGRQAFKENLESVLNSGHPLVFDVAADDWLGGGTYRISAGPVRDGTEVTALTVVAEDVTRQREMEARLLLSERLAAIGTLAAGVAHEINNPLTYVMGNLELLQQQLGETTEDVQSRLVEALEGAERVASCASTARSSRNISSSSRAV